MSASNGTTVKKRRADVLNEQKRSESSVDQREALVVNYLALRNELARRSLERKRDIDAECDYPKHITAHDYRLMFEREPLARKAVTIYPKECFAMPPEVYETEEERETDFEREFVRVRDKFNLWNLCRRADIAARIGRFGLIVIGIRDGKDLSQPADGIDAAGNKEGNAAFELDFLNVFDETLVTVVSTEQNKRNPRYGQPVLYEIKLEETTTDVSGEVSTKITTQRVHWSRCVHLAEDCVTSSIYARPIQESIYNRLLDLRKVQGGASEMFWKGGFPGYNFEMDPMIASEADLDFDKLRNQIENYSHGLTRYLATIGVKVNSLSPQVADPRPHVETIIRAIAIALDIPYRILLGSEEAKLASTQDARTWNKRVMARCRLYVEPMIIRALIDRLMMFGVLPWVEKYYLDWPDLNASTDEDRVKIAVSMTAALARYTKDQVWQFVPFLEYLTTVLGMSLKQAEQMDKARKRDQRNVERRLRYQQQKQKQTRDKPAPGRQTQQDLLGRSDDSPPATDRPTVV